MDTRTKIWNELADAKLGDYYLICYLAEKKNGSHKLLKYATAILAITTALSTYFKAPIFAYISLLGIGLSVLLDNYKVGFFEEYANISTLRIKFYDKAHQLERLWNDFNNDIIAEDIARKRFVELNSLTMEIDKLDIELGIKNKQKLYERARELTLKYLESYN